MNAKIREYLENEHQEKINEIVLLEKKVRDLEKVIKATSLIKEQ